MVPVHQLARPPLTKCTPPQARHFWAVRAIVRVGSQLGSLDIEAGDGTTKNQITPGCAWPAPPHFDLDQGGYCHRERRRSGYAYFLAPSRLAARSAIRSYMA